MNVAPRKMLVILQSNYIPWKGYFDLLAAADEFFIFDEVQFTRRDWRNRNKLIVAGQPRWLTIPVQTKGRYDAPIDEIEVMGSRWAREHWQTISLNYRRAPFFEEIAPRLEAAYHNAENLTLLTEINELFLKELALILGIRTPLVRDRSVPRTTNDPTARLVEICVSRGATDYLSGPAAKSYIDRAQFDAARIRLHYANYTGYPVYDQGSPAFEHGVSMIDTLMQCGTAARGHLKSIREDSSLLQPE
ncbi:WbqC-like protein family protein [Mesorhizobium albiziae]|uniref:WbqC-like protein family protein n=1 Tax=Neomesorhizobium albiziae TaxID=335020 RepID=A0A1I4DYE7_9HYPH|nr:WbqC family protein [Mesorhizobium albiziae]GLS32777.1 hypothetical protein GCM10007937_44870 [Mesorhizobium albiziae]SFK97287.1 WbqC-like protein family protein [Mesorhizobium albiziae]